MLVLSRKISEEVVITVGDVVIRCMVIELKNDKVRIGFDAPKDVKIHRLEIQDIVDREARQNVFNQTLHAQQKRNSGASDTPDLPAQSSGDS